MNHTAPTHGSAIRSIPPNRLVIAPVNVRKTPPVVIADAEMTASIAAHGLLENLVVRSDGPDSDYAVVAGGRRFIGGLRDECLNKQLFTSYRYTREIIENWRADYNARRSHTSLCGPTPIGFTTRSREDHKTKPPIYW